ncbi:MAG TPA: hypothetical protein VFC18_21310 [Burkholderiales bacterium]|nr:hypothetical protein [Burkholderiales bacterium]
MKITVGTTTVTLDTHTANATYGMLNCREVDSVKRNYVCNLPATTSGGIPFRVPAGVQPAGTLQFEITRTVAATVSGTALGAEFVAICNAAVLNGPCDNTIQYKFQNSTIKKVGGTNGVKQDVKLEMGFTMGVLPTASVSDLGRAHGFESRGQYVPPTLTTSVVGNTHNAVASFIYVQSSATCGTTDAPTPEPFSIAGCTARATIPCSSPLTSTTTGVTCTSTGGTYQVKSLTSKSITSAGNIKLVDSIQKTCGALFGGGKTCRAIERGEATLTYGLKNLNDKVNITASGAGHSGPFQNVLALSEAEGVRCYLHNSTGGTTINPNSQGQFQIRVLGSANFDTNTMDFTTTALSLPGGNLIPARSIRYNETFTDPETGVADEFFDATVVYDSSNLAPPAPDGGGISCADFSGQEITLVQQQVADVTVSGTVLVQDHRPKPRTVATFENEPVTLLTSCEVPVTVGPCNNP